MNLRLPTFARRLALALGAALAAAAVQAAPFEVAVTPSRLELATKGGARLGQSLEIHNLGTSATEISVRTLDWTFSAAGEVAYYDALQPGSCRPWVTLERKTVKVPPRGKASFRFQVEAPAEASRGECRFMIAIEGVEPAYQAELGRGGASLTLPVTGRIAVPIYVAVNGAEPKMTLTQVGMKGAGATRKAVMVVRNEGDAHGRLGGSLDAVDARGTEFEMAPEGTPVLPGQTRTLELSPRGEGGKPVEPVYPVKLKGAVDWNLGSFKVEADLR